MRSVRSVATEAIDSASKGLRKPRSPDAIRELIYGLIAVGAFSVVTIVFIFTFAR